MQGQSWGMSGQGPQLYQPPWTPFEAPEVPIHHQMTPGSAACTSRRRKRKEYDNNSIGRSAAGIKPNQVTVTPTGDIDGGCAGKNAWDESVRTFVPRILDMSIVEWDRHKPETLTKLREALDSEFEYIGNTLSMKGFRNVVKRFLKSERSRLKKVYLAGNDTCPMQVQPDQWKNLKAYWKRSDQVKKAAIMTAARQQVKNVSKVGRRGKAGREAALIKNNDSSPGLTEIAEGLQASEADGTSRAVSSLGNARFAAVEARQDRVENQMGEVLASNKRTADALETLQTTLMEYLCKDRSSASTATLKSKTLGAGPSTIIVGGDDADNDPYSLEHILKTRKQMPQEAHSTKDLLSPSHATVRPRPSVEKKNNSGNLEIEGNPDVSTVLACPNMEQESELMKKDNTITKQGGGGPTKRDLLLAPQDEERKSATNEDMLPKQRRGKERSSSAKGKTINSGKDVEEGRNEPHVIMKEDSTLQTIGNVEDLPPSPKKRKKSPKSTTQKREAEKVFSDNRRTDLQKTHKFTLGQQVSLVNPKIPKQQVARATVTAIGGGDKTYHGGPIPKGWYRVDVLEALAGFTPLMMPNEAGEQYRLKDVVGSNTIWEEKFTRPSR